MNAIKEEEKSSLNKNDINDKTKVTIKNEGEYIKKTNNSTTDSRNESKSTSIKTNDNTELQENEDNNVDNVMII